MTNTTMTIVESAINTAVTISEGAAFYAVSMPSISAANAALWEICGRYGIEIKMGDGTPVFSINTGVETILHQSKENEFCTQESEFLEVVLDVFSVHNPTIHNLVDEGEGTQLCPPSKGQSTVISLAMVKNDPNSKNWDILIQVECPTALNAYFSKNGLLRLLGHGGTLEHYLPKDE